MTHHHTLTAAFAAALLSCAPCALTGQNTVYCSRGNASGGSGTQSAPYGSLSEALQAVQPGGTLVLVGAVTVPATGTLTDRAELPLILSKPMTITADASGGSLSSRYPLQLSADVTMKDVRLELVPETVLDGTQGESSGLFGTRRPMSPTIFLAGHSLTLDNVDTRLGSNANQWDEAAPYVSGGRYHAVNADCSEVQAGAWGTGSVLRTINSNEHTRLADIHAGGYDQQQVVGMTVDLDEGLRFRSGHGRVCCGGTPSADGSNAWRVTGNVDITLRGVTRLRGVKRIGHTGSCSLTLAPRADLAPGTQAEPVTNLSLAGVDALTLDNAARLSIAKNDQVSLKSLSVKEQGELDMSALTATLAVAGGATFEAGATLTVGHDEGQLLEVGGKLEGSVAVNALAGALREGHVYVRASDQSTCTLTPGERLSGYEFKRTEAAGLALYTAHSLPAEEGELPASIKFVSGYTQIAPEVGKEFRFAVQLLRADGSLLKPAFMDLADYYPGLMLDGELVDTDFDPYYDVDWDSYDAEATEAPIELVLQWGLAENLPAAGSVLHVSLLAPDDAGPIDIMEVAVGATDVPWSAAAEEGTGGEGGGSDNNPPGGSDDNPPSSSDNNPPSGSDNNPPSGTEPPPTGGTGEDHNALIAVCQEDQQAAQYFDLQGRSLPQPPRRGIYIERGAKKTRLILAR